jgi:NAD(P)H-hydrate repair Nnr-like enzyme with NAD(P)H-hydrate dehydratase domain
MNLSACIARTGVEVVCCPNPTAELTTGYTSDMLSDVIGHCPEDSVLITIQNHNNTVAACTLVGAAAILLAHNRDIPADMLATATAKQIAILRTPLDQYHATCLIANALSS